MAVKFGYQAPARQGGGIKSPIYKPSPKAVSNASLIDMYQKRNAGLASIGAIGGNLSKYSFSAAPSGSTDSGYSDGGYGGPYPAYKPDVGTGVDTGGGGATTGADSETELDKLRKERLAAALKAIGTDFDFQEGNLNAQLEALKKLFTTETLKNNRNEQYAQEAILDSSVERGIFNSGITLKNVARGLTPFQEQRAQLIGSLNPTEGAEGTDLRNLMSAIELLVQQRTDSEASAKLDSTQEKLDIEKLMELLKAGLSP